MLHPDQPVQHSHHPHSTENVGEVDRWISGTFGASLLLSSLRRGGFTGLIGSCIGSALVYRAATGHCPMQESIDRNAGRARFDQSGPPAPADTVAGATKTPYQVRHATDEPADKVQEASEESFPASDAPGWGPDRL